MWSRPRPTDQTGSLEKTKYHQEIYDRIRFGTFSWTPPAVPADSSVEFVISTNGPDVFSGVANGFRVGSFVGISPPAFIGAGLSLYGLCNLKNTATVVIVNPTPFAVTPPSGDWSLIGVVI